MHPEAATFVITMVQHRVKLDIYGLPTLEGAARLIDGGSTLTYLFQAAARSAVVSGEFEMAKRLFESIDEGQMEEIDKTLEFLLDEYRESFEAEKLIREQEEQADRLPRVAIRTTQGDVVVELFIDQAPSAVANFIQLVEEGFYDDLDFHQVIDHLLALTGDSAGDGSGNSGRYLVDEHDRQVARKAFRGSLVMAKLPMGDSGEFFPNSASSQFAIIYLPMISISEHQTVFGRVIEGMDAISRLRRVDPSKKKTKGKVELPPDRIIEATVIRRPETLPEPKYWDPSQR
jgi:cyclophilin family peptidyl-prolyl cis-trans isomerase